MKVCNNELKFYGEIYSLFTENAVRIKRVTIMHENP